MHADRLDDQQPPGTGRAPRVLTALATAALLLAGCGSDDGADSTEIPADPDLTIRAAPNNSFKYQEKSAEAQAGEISIVFDNPASLQHDLRIEDSEGADLGGTEVISNDKRVLDIELDPGTYEYYCSVPGHRAGGMVGTLRVE